MISCVILTHNNATNIGSILDNLTWCDERIIVDDDSTDATRTIAKNHGAAIIQQRLQDDFAAQRNRGLTEAKGEWVLFVDTDEDVSDDLAREIQEKCRGGDSSIVGYYLPRIDTMWGRVLRYGETGDIKLLRLAKKEAGKWTRKVHEVWNVQGKTDVCIHPLLHSPHPDVKTFLAEINRYTTINAKIFFDLGKRVNACDVIAYPMGKFFQNYIVKRGYKDGSAGFIFAMLMAFHSFLTRAKLWQLWDTKQ